MKRENDEITDLFRSRLGHAEMTVRESFWEELNEDVAACCQQRRRVLFFRVNFIRLIYFHDILRF